MEKSLGEETQQGPKEKKKEPCRFYIVPAMDFPTMVMELLQNKLVSIDGGLPHGEWSREAEKSPSSGTMSRTQKKQRRAPMTMW